MVAPLQRSLAGNVHVVEEESSDGEPTKPPVVAYSAVTTPAPEYEDTDSPSEGDTEEFSDSESAPSSGVTESPAQLVGSDEEDTLSTPEQPNGFSTQPNESVNASSSESLVSLTSEHSDSDAEVTTSGASGDNEPHNWFTLTEVVNTSRKSVIRLEHRIPNAQKYEIRRTRTGIQLAQQEGLKIPNVDDAALAKQGLFICKLTWKVVVDAQGALRWHRLGHGPCNQTYTGRHNWIRHFKDGHIGKTRPRK
ncbi:hypothetical protein CPB86DRAFT_390115 [Serendipita vermifera]|nr:hypothetical protein CPB86DRAFT_390115 [Serendipita vermifera]